MFSTPSRSADLPLLVAARPLLWLPLVTTLAIGCGGSELLDPDNPTAPEIYVGRDFSCALSRDATVRCWGRNNRGQLGDGTTTDRETPQLISGDLAFQSIDIDGTSGHTCGVTTDGDAFCWGENDFGQLGDGSVEVSTVPVPVLGNQTFKAVSAGWRMSCGVATTGAAYCWGRGVWGQLGDGLAIQSVIPVQVSGGHVFEVVEVGGNNLVCGLTTAGQILCWGLDWVGSLGAPSVESCSNGQITLACATTPMPIRSDETFKAIAVGLSYACGIATDGHLWCWGRNSLGQLGTAADELCGTTEEGSPRCSRMPIRISEVPTLSMVTAGADHTCGVTEEDIGWCWGSNLFGQLGRGNAGAMSEPPAPVLGVPEFHSINAGTDHTCGVSAHGDLYCWGANFVGQLGTGTTESGLVPLLVTGQADTGGGG